MTTIKEVLQQYQSGAGRYSYCIVSDITTVPQAVAAQKDDNEDFDLYRPCIALHEDLPPEHSEGLEQSSEQKKDVQQEPMPKRPWCTKQMRAADTATAGITRDSAAIFKAAADVTRCRHRCYGPRMRAESSRVQAGIGKGALRYGAPTIHKCFKKIRKQCLPNDFYGL
ncbi:uncharacterized protein LOC142786783 isoform X1 [Rhipicephalus microplus]|uniref:uncharacterized protein LOC142786783 isoform X1 n=1 Tax=Rhipicephalus microplus TaxID=6941 RepID=UPI003F6C0B0E